jgi:ABC-type amino acid transport substrate-binding protein
MAHRKGVAETFGSLACAATGPRRRALLARRRQARYTRRPHGATGAFTHHKEVDHVKRLLAVILSAAALAVAGFSASAAAQTPAPRAPATDTLAKLKATKQINVAVSADSFPLSFIKDKGDPIGYSIDLCKRVIVQLGRAAGVPDLKTNWIPGTVSERIAMVASGKADLDCANTTATLTRMQDVDFSSLIFLETGGLLVKEGGPVQKFVDLSGRTIGVISGTTTETRVDALLKQRLINAKVTRVKDGNEALALLEKGALDAFASDKVKLVGLAVQAKDPKSLAILGEDLSIEPLAFAVPRGDSSFRLEVNRALTQVYMGGELESIFMAWLGPIGRPSGMLGAMYLLNAIPQ